MVGGRLISSNDIMKDYRFTNFYDFMKSDRLINFYKLPINKRKNFDNEFLNI